MVHPLLALALIWAFMRQRSWRRERHGLRGNERTSAVNAHEKSGNRIMVMNIDSLNSSFCNIGSGSTGRPRMTDPEYPVALEFEATVLTKHDPSGNSQSSTYRYSSSRICFNPDGTSKGGGFEVTRDAGTKFRVDIGPTSFYDVTRYSPQQRTWIEWN